ncbi:hypothetical protein F5B17DRAFT_383573 [Nemania serpens]|nr:hypothetical protein F5B17DRAFT_383573 [Nemania serpens]
MQLESFGAGIQAGVSTATSHILLDQRKGIVFDLLQGMLVVDQTQRLTTRDCMMMGLGAGLFKRRAVDGLVACALDEEQKAVAGLVGGEEALSHKPQTDIEDNDPVSLSY